MEAEIDIARFKQSSSDDHWGDLQDVRPMEVSFRTNKECMGSVAYSQGETLALCTIRGPDRAPGWMKASKGAVIQISCRPALRRPDLESTWIEVMCKKMLKRIVNVQKFPWSTFRIGLQGVQDGGSMSATMFNAMILAIVHSGLPIKNPLVAVKVVFKSDGTIVVDPGEAQEWDSSASLFLVYDTSNFKIVGSQTRGKVDLKSFRLASAVGATAARRVCDFIRSRISDALTGSLGWK